jgi:hypothetical protein
MRLWTSTNYDASVDFVDDGNVTNIPGSGTYYIINHGFAVKFKVVSINGTYKYKAIRTRPYNVTDTNRLIENDSHVLVTDTGTDGNINFTTDNTSRWNITSAGHIIPATNASYDIGEAENKVRDLYLSSNSLHIGSDVTHTYTLGKDADNDLNWTIDGEANKIATQAYVLANAGGNFQIEETNAYFQTGNSWETNKNAIWLLTTTNTSIGGDLVRPPTNGVAGDTFNYIVTGLSTYTWSISPGVTVWENGSVLTGYYSVYRTDRYVLNRYLCVGNNTWVKLK